MSVTSRQTFRSTFRDKVPVIAPLYSVRCETWVLSHDGSFTCGSGTDCSLRLDLPGIESRHCSFDLQNGSLLVTRERGRVWINDVPVGSASELKQGDVLTLGPVSFSIESTHQTSSNPVHTTIGQIPLSNSQQFAPGHSPSAYFNAVLSPGDNPRDNFDCQKTVVASAIPLKSQDIGIDLKAREDQLQEKLAIIAERERLIAERQQAHEERCKFLLEQKAVFESQQQTLVASQLLLKQHQEEFDQRVRSLVDREHRVAQQLEDSSRAHLQLEQAHTRLSDELERIRLREAAVTERSSELLRISKENEELRAHLLAEQNVAIVQRQTLDGFEGQLAKDAQQIFDQKTEIQRYVDELHKRETDLASREQKLHDALVRTSTVDELTNKLADAAKEIEDLRSHATTLQLQLEAVSSQRPAESGTPTETRTVEQLAAIVQEREAALRARQEAYTLHKQVQESKEALAAEKDKLQKWQLEVDSRHSELAERVIFLKAAVRNSQLRTRDATPSPDFTDSLNAQRLLIQEEREAIREEGRELRERQAEFRAAEARLAELQAAAREVRQTAESEREALHTSHKDLILERNAQQQKAQDLQIREAGLCERELVVSRQTEDLRSRSEAINSQTAELRQFEAELNARSTDIHHRILAWKAERNSYKAPSNNLQPSQALHSSDSSLAIELSEVKDQNERLTRERESLVTAIREMQKTLQDARADVEEASRIRSTSMKQEQTIAQLYQQIESQSNQLQLSESRYHQICRDLEEARKLASVELQTPSSSTLLEITQPGTHQHDDQEDELLSQINSLRSELSQSAGENSTRLSEYTRLIAERDSQIENLEKMIVTLRDELNAHVVDVKARASAPAEIDESELDLLKDRLERAEHVLQDRDDLIRELRSRLIHQTRAVAPTNSDSAQTPNREALLQEQRELDRRAELLDHRDEELRERSRRLQQTEEEVESQRRQLLDARQQLEIARAEIQVAMKQHSAKVTAPQPTLETRGLSSGRGYGLDHEPVQRYGSEESGDQPFNGGTSAGPSENEEHGDLRTELASLFGLKKAPADMVDRAANGQSGTASDFVDLSEPTGKSQSIALKFGEDASSIVSLHTAEEHQEIESPKEENSDDFVRDYMEQLLARSRKAAGVSLPSELKQPASKTQATTSAPQSGATQQSAIQTSTSPVRKSDPASPARKETPKVKSFIEQYMSGGFGDLTGEGTFSPPEQVETNDHHAEDHHEPAESRQPRQKVDLQKLRDEMHSFRTLSTQSVEHALVDHAIRKERHSINGRVMFVAVLVVMTLFLALANAKNIINQPSLIWVTLVAAIGAVAELGRKYMALKTRCRVGLQGEQTHSSEATPSAEENLQPVAVTHEPPIPAAPLNKKPIAKIDLDETADRQLEGRYLLQRDDDREGSRYFEL